ncbi:MAG: hypothetical protein ABJA83_00480 [Burkholderiaceae bacterium]
MSDARSCVAFDPPASAAAAFNVPMQLDELHAIRQHEALELDRALRGDGAERFSR